jgi:hypothetical protein
MIYRGLFPGPNTAREDAHGPAGDLPRIRGRGQALTKNY